MVLTNINNSQNAIAVTQEQLSTGRSINQPSDNPYGASLAISLNGDLSGLSMYQSNVNDGTAWATAAGTAMQNITSMTQRVQELVVQASNGTQSATDLQAAAQEVNQLTASIEQEANTQYNGQYVFSGTSTNTQPYAAATGDVYQGNTAQVLRTIGPGTSLQVNTDLSSVLGSGPTANDGLLLNTLRNITADMNSGHSGLAQQPLYDRHAGAPDEPRLDDPGAGRQRRRPEPALARHDPDPGAADERHAGPLQRPGRQHGERHDDLFQPAGCVHGRVARRSEYRSAITDELPERMTGSAVALTIDSPRFGTIEIDPETVIEFPEGLIGLGGSRYALLTSDPGSPLMWLHCIDDPTLSLPVTDPHRFFSDYSVKLTDEDAERLGLDDATPVDVLVTVRSSPVLSEFTANQKAPILIWGGRGYQIINQAPGCDLRAALFAEVLASSEPTGSEC